MCVCIVKILKTSELSEHINLNLRYLCKKKKRFIEIVCNIIVLCTYLMHTRIGYN